MRGLQSARAIANSLAPSLSTLPAAILGVSACRLRGLEGFASKPEAMPDALDQEFDRGDDPEMARIREAEFEEKLAERRRLAGVVADLEYELDRDDPECADPSEVWAEGKPPCPPPEVDLDTEFDRDDPMLADKSHLWDAPEPPQPADISGELDLMADAEDVPRGARLDVDAASVAGEQPRGAAAGAAPFGQGGSRREREGPDARVGQFREGAP